ncbi:MAG TPA: NAD-dependent epimerase/dehydratase family protein [Acidimicrobiia bacterium]|nr:NAD-dependent epimerase/dehydratase family protein [Acidimicrobiia bacterium]
MRIFVTGGSGFIGGALLARLARDHHVRAMARSADSAAVVQERGGEAVECDLASVSVDHLRGTDVVVHCAALASDWAPPGAFQTVNVDGTQRMLAMARRAGIRRFVHMSSDSALFAGRPLVDVDEDTPYPHSSAYRYADSKRRAEQLVRAQNSDDFETVCIRPVLVWGPGDTTVLNELVTMADRGAFVWVDGGRHLVSTTHIDNVVQGVALAIERGRPGGVYFLTDGDPVSYRDFFTDYLATADRSVGSRSVPGVVVRVAGSAVERVWRLLRPQLRPPVTREGAAILATTITASSARAVRELGYSPIPRQQAMAALGRRPLG